MNHNDFLKQIKQNQDQQGYFQYPDSKSGNYYANSPNKSPSRSPDRSPHKSPTKSPDRSPTKSPDMSPTRRQQQSRIIPYQPPTKQELFERRHPSTRINHLALLVSILNIAYGITIVSYSCGTRYIAITVFGFIMFFFCLCTFYRKKIDRHRGLFYGISAFVSLITGVVSFVFISQINEQIFCNSQWCHKEVETRDFFKDYLQKKYSDQFLSNQCRKIDSQYNSTREHEELGQFLIKEMLTYCKFSPSSCDNSGDLYKHIYWHNLGITRGIIITLGVLEILYAFWLVWWLRYRNPRDDVYAYDSNGNTSVQMIDANGSMIVNPATIIQQQGMQYTTRNQQYLEQRVQQKINDPYYQQNQSNINTNRNVKQQDNGLIYLGNDGTQANFKNNSSNYYDQDNGRKVALKPLQNNPNQSNIQQNSQLYNQSDSNPGARKHQLNSLINSGAHQSRLNHQNNSKQNF